MAILSELKYQQGMKVSEISAFKGINARGNIKSGEMSECQHLGFQNYPALSMAREPGIYQIFDQSVTVSALFVWDGHVIVVADNKLYYDGAEKCSVMTGPKQFAVVNTKVIIWPDKLYLDLTTGYLDSLGLTYRPQNIVSYSGSTFTFPQESKYLWGQTQLPTSAQSSMTMYVYTGLQWSASGWSWTDRTLKTVSSLSSGDIIIPYINDAATYGGLPIDGKTENSKGYYGNIYMNDSDGIHFGVYSYSATTSISDMFSAGDTIDLNGQINGVQKGLKVTAVTATTMTVDAALGNGSYNGLEITRVVPDLDYICSCNNRLYGCSNKAVSNIYNAVTKKYETYYSRCIYVSALGQPDKFYDFSGTDTDSFQVAVASEGDFTAAIALDGSVIFHKEKKIYRLYGEYPSNFYLSEYIVPGCASGCSKTCKVINGVLYYLSRHGVYSYSGNTPVYISWPLGELDIITACAGIKDTRYYISIIGTSSTHVYIYDTDLGFWLEDYGLKYSVFAEAGSDLYCARGNSIEIAEKNDPKPGYGWKATLKDEDEGTIERKYYQYLRLRLYLPAESWLKVIWQFDDGPALHSQIIRSQGKYADRTVVIPLNNNRADRITIGFEGRGDIQVKTLQRIYTLGTGEVR